MSERHTVRGYCIVDADSAEEAIEASTYLSDVVWVATAAEAGGRQPKGVEGARFQYIRRTWGFGWVAGAVTLNAMPDIFRIVSHAAGRLVA